MCVPRKWDVVFFLFTMLRGRFFVVGGSIEQLGKQLLILHPDLWEWFQLFEGYIQDEGFVPLANVK